MSQRYVVVLVFALLGACGGEEESENLRVAWTFSNGGDCASNGVDTVHVEWTTNGETKQAEFPCADGEGDLGPADEGSYSFTAEGRDADGNAVAESYGQSTTFSGGIPPYPVDITLHPASVNVTVSWTVAGLGTCPSGVTLPFFVSLYEPGDGAELGAKVTEQQESCASGSTTLENVAPGDYVVEVDSRAVTPAVRGTTMLTVEAGMDAEVSLDL